MFAEGDPARVGASRDLVGLHSQCSAAIGCFGATPGSGMVWAWVAEGEASL